MVFPYYTAPKFQIFHCTRIHKLLKRRAKRAAYVVLLLLSSDELRGLISQVRERNPVNARFGERGKITFRNASTVRWIRILRSGS